MRVVLDEKRKKWYDSNMENTNEINEKIAKNLIAYRKAAGMTQAELAEKINYSDKSVSKWESGNGVPDVYTLMQLAALFGVTLNDLVGDGALPKTEKKSGGLHLLIILLSSGLVWLVATCFFVLMQIISPGKAWWLAFIYAIPINSILMIVYASVWKYRILNFVAVSTLVWTAITCLYLTVRCVSIALGASYEGFWMVYLLGIPLQVLEVLWVFFRTLFRKKTQEENSASASADDGAESVTEEK